MRYVHGSPVVDDAAALLHWAAQRQQFSKRDTHHALDRRFARADDLDAPLRELIERGWIHPDGKTQQKGRGRPPSPRFVVHPQAQQMLSRLHYDPTDEGDRNAGETWTEPISVPFVRRFRTRSKCTCDAVR